MSNLLINCTYRRLAIPALLCLITASLSAEEWTVPLAGNTYRTEPSPGGNNLRRNGLVSLSSPDTVMSVFFHVDRPADLDLALNASSRSGSSKLDVSCGMNEFTVAVNGTDVTRQSIGRIKIDSAGYQRLDLQRSSQGTGSDIAIRDLLITSETEGLKVSFVRDNKGGMFYWGRRGPSVHLRYGVPGSTDLRYAYSEITVPEGEDPIGSYFMANGFAQGYFGIQVNSERERRVLFSVWSPFKTDNPRDIPKDQRIAALARGKDVHIGEFGNEGSGGQSYLVYPWKAGRTYRFLTSVEPDGNGNTVYTSWFGDKQKNEWRLIASFRRPKTDTHLRGFHSFLENFSPATGHIGRRAFYGNVWVQDVDGEWHQCTQARFSVDPTGGGQHRLDFDGGAEGTRFFLKNCGFFNDTGKAGESFERKKTEQPSIDLDSLPTE